MGTCLVGFYRAITIKQQSKGRHVASTGHNILIPSQQVLVFLLAPYFSCRSNNHQLHTPWFDPTVSRTDDTPQSRRAR